MSSLVPVCPEQLLDTKFCRSIGMSECRNIGMSAHRSVGTSECRHIGMSEYRNVGTSEYRNTESGIPEKLESDLLEVVTISARCSEVLSFFPGELLRGRNTTVHWRVPDAELYLKETLNFEFYF